MTDCTTDSVLARIDGLLGRLDDAEHAFRVVGDSTAVQSETLIAETKALLIKARRKLVAGADAAGIDADVSQREKTVAAVETALNNWDSAAEQRRALSAMRHEHEANRHIRPDTPVVDPVDLRTRLEGLRERANTVQTSLVGQTGAFGVRVRDVADKVGRDIGRGLIDVGSANGRQDLLDGIARGIGSIEHVVQFAESEFAKWKTEQAAEREKTVEALERELAAARAGS